LNVAQRTTRAGDLGEFPLIARLTARLGATRPDVVVGIGDDVAAFAVGPERLLLATCDVQVAGTHFLPDRCDPFRLGRKAAAINVSDIAATGGSPTHFLSSLIVPAATEVGFLERLYDGLADEAARWDADVLGGNISGGERLVIDLTLLGEARPDALLRRDGAAVGDRILVTGSVGGAAAGLQLQLRPELKVDRTVRVEATDAFELPTPRVIEARALVAVGGVNSAIDLSDGLVADLGHVCDASGVGARLAAQRIPLAPCARDVARAAGRDALDWALGGGEDYQLLFTVPPPRVAGLIRAVSDACGTTVSDIGEIVSAERGRSLVLADGNERPFADEGWRHF
jgi:thiamine-monophosphate kinase